MKYVKKLIFLSLLIGLYFVFTSPQFQVLMGTKSGKHTTADQKTYEAWWYRKAAEQGYAPGQYLLGLMLARGWGGVQQDLKEAEKWFRKAAEQGELGSMNMLGEWYAEGRVFPQNYQEAANWYKKAAEKGSCTAQFELGLLSAKGLGVQKNVDEAEKLFLQASKGYHIAHHVGKMFFWGNELPKDFRKAADWFFNDRIDESESDLYLGRIFLQGGCGIQQDSFKAIRFFQKAAAKNHSQAQYELGLIYYHGQAGKPDLQEAEKWFQKSASMGNASAQAQLKLMKQQDSLPASKGN